MKPVVGRFAPSPSGPLHAGSLVAATASSLDVRARGGRWLLRIEDLDRPRELPGAAEDIVETLRACGFHWDGPIVRQSERTALYRDAFEALRADGAVYPCGCTRREIEEAVDAGIASIGATVYPGTCRQGLPRGRAARAWRMRVPDAEHVFHDRAAGRVQQNVAREVGDFVVRRADGLWAYQLAVVVDDAAQGVTDVVRGADLLDSTPRQRVLQTALGLPHPRTLHVPLVLDETGEKLAKSSGAAAIDRSAPLPALHRAALHLGLDFAPATTLEAFWVRATEAWALRWPVAQTGTT
jgi:glutamyl-Q tRNA(Asp) synthetase